MITIQIESPQEEVLIDGKTYLLCPKEQLTKLLDDNIELKKHNAEMRSDLSSFKKAIAGILNVLGLLDSNTGTIKESIQKGEESYLKHIGKALTSVMSDIMLKREKKLAERFSFIQNVIPLINKCAKLS